MKIRKLEGSTNKYKGLIDLKKEMERIEMVAKVASSVKEDHKESSVEPSTKEEKKKKRMKLKENEELPATDKKRIKCFFNNKGLCTRENCRFEHAEKLCRTFNEFEFCKDEKTCNYRHPRKICKFWSGMSHCKMGDLCKFRHPVIRPESDNQHQHSFLDRRTNKPKYRSPENQLCQTLSTEKTQM